MKELIGVKGFYFINDFLKRQALLFDKIAIPHLEPSLQFHKKYFRDQEKEIQVVNEWEWLKEQDFLFDASEYELKGRLIEKDEDLKKEVARLLKEVDESNPYFQKLFTDKLSQKELYRKIEKKGHEITSLYISFLVRFIALNLRINHNFDSHPIIDTINLPPNIQHSIFSKAGVLHVVINSLPIPDELTPWEEIFQFRKEPESRNKLLGLRNWMREMTRANLSMDEIEEKLEWMLDDYQKYMKLQRFKVKKGRLEAFIIGSAEFIENLAKLNLSRVSKSLFSIKYRKIPLLEAEMTAPGREISYIVGARERFERLKEKT